MLYYGMFMLMSVLDGQWRNKNSTFYVKGSNIQYWCHVVIVKRNVISITTNHLWQLLYSITTYHTHNNVCYRNLREMLVILTTIFSWNQSTSQCLTRDYYNLWTRPTSMASLIPILNTSLNIRPSILHYFNTLFLFILTHYFY